MGSKKQQQIGLKLKLTKGYLKEMSSGTVAKSRKWPAKCYNITIAKT